MSGSASGAAMDVSGIEHSDGELAALAMLAMHHHSSSSHHSSHHHQQEHQQQQQEHQRPHALAMPAEEDALDVLSRTAALHRHIAPFDPPSSTSTTAATASAAQTTSIHDDLQILLGIVRGTTSASGGASAGASAGVGAGAGADLDDDEDDDDDDDDDPKAMERFLQPKSQAGIRVGEAYQASIPTRRSPEIPIVATVKKSRM